MKDRSLFTTKFIQQQVAVLLDKLWLFPESAKSLQSFGRHYRAAMRFRGAVAGAAFSSSKVLCSMQAVAFSPPKKPALTSSTSYRCFLLRHGETDANAGGLIQGSSDFSRLTKSGKHQATTAAREAFCPLSSCGNKHDTTGATVIDSVYVSPLTRARETWEIVALNANPETLVLPPNETVLRDLREIDLYQWEGRHKDELQTANPESYHAWKVGDPHGFVVSANNPRGEGNTDNNQKQPLLELWARADKVWKEIKEMESCRVKSKIASVSYNHDESLPASCSLLVSHGSLGQALLGSAMGWDATHFRKYEFPNCGLLEIEWEGDMLWQKTVNATRWRWRWPHVSKWRYKNHAMQ